MKDYLNNLIKSLDETTKHLSGEAKAEKELVICKVELEGIDAIQFRALMGICDEGKEAELISTIFKVGLHTAGFSMREYVKENI